MSLLIGIYSRVSTDEQASVVEGSLTNQQHRMKAFIEIKNLQEKGWGDVIEHYIDDGYSAKDTNRPAYQRMLKDLKRGRINMIMVTELSRLSRSIPDFCDFLKALDSQNGKFFSIKEQFDTSTSAGKMMLYNMINLAQFEREQISERVSINAHARSLRGLLSGGPTVLGYDKDPSNSTTYVVNSTEAEQVRTIFELFLEQGSIGKTIRKLELLGIKQKVRNNKRNRLVKEGRWTVDSLSYLLQNKAYIGLKEVNKVHKNKDQKILKSWEKHTIVKASWPPIVDNKIFQSVQEAIQFNKNHERTRLETAEKRIFLVSSLCRCGECGRRLVGQSAHGDKSIHRYYIHSQKAGDVINCSWKRIKAEDLEDRIIGRLTDMLSSAGYLEKIESNIRQSNSVRPADLKEKKSRITKELKSIDAIWKNTFQIQTAIQDEKTLRDVAAELERLSQQRRNLEAELNSVADVESREEKVNEAIFSLNERLEQFKKGWAKASSQQKKSLLRCLIHQVTVRPDKLEIEYFLHSDLNSKKQNQIPDSSKSNILDLKKYKVSNKTRKPDATVVHGSSQDLHIIEIGVPKGI